MGMPWRLAFALQADGWYLRQDIIWAKPNPMPESVTDRCTKAHEYVFLLSKSRAVFLRRRRDQRSRIQVGSGISVGQVTNRAVAGVDNHLGSWSVARDPGERHRNKRSVWTIATEPYPEAHFATFPTELPRPASWPAQG